MAIVIYHNPRCSKSRETLRRIEAAGHTPRVVEYLKDPPDAATLDALCRKLSMAPQALVRTRETVFETLGLSLDDHRSRSEWLNLLAEHPILMERPIVLNGNRAVLGRPPENVDVLL